MTAARGAAYYDASYERVIRLKDPDVWALMRERCAKIVPHVTGETVLDVACGLGLLAEYFNGRYTGVDFAPIAIEYAKSQCPTAEFIEADVFQFLLKSGRRFDTVILSEIQEHVAYPVRLYELAAATANKRIVWTVPRDLDAPAHVWPIWPEQSIDLMLSLVEGECVVKEQFGGEDGQRWWLVVQEVEK